MEIEIIIADIFLIICANMCLTKVLSSVIHNEKKEISLILCSILSLILILLECKTYQKSWILIIFAIIFIILFILTEFVKTIKIEKKE